MYSLLILYMYTIMYTSLSVHNQVLYIYIYIYILHNPYMLCRYIITNIDN